MRYLDRGEHRRSIGAAASTSPNEVVCDTDSELQAF